MPWCQPRCPCKREAKDKVLETEFRVISLKCREHGNRLYRTAVLEAEEGEEGILPSSSPANTVMEVQGNWFWLVTRRPLRWWMWVLLSQLHPWWSARAEIGNGYTEPQFYIPRMRTRLGDHFQDCAKLNNLAFGRWSSCPITPLILSLQCPKQVFYGVTEVVLPRHPILAGRDVCLLFRVSWWGYSERHKRSVGKDRQ